LEVNWGNNSNEFTQELRVNQTKENYNLGGGCLLPARTPQPEPGLRASLDIDRFYGPGAGDGLASRQFARNTQVTDAYAAFGQGEYNLTRIAAPGARRPVYPRAPFVPVQQPGAVPERRHGQLHATGSGCRQHEPPAEFRIFPIASA
jgi:hypothetical protein